MLGGSGSVLLFCGTADVQEAVHRMGGPLRLSQFFGMPPTRTNSVSLQHVDGARLDADSRIIPMPRSLPMTFSWSLFTQNVDEQAVSEVLSTAVAGQRKADGLEPRSRDAEHTAQRLRGAGVQFTCGR